MNTLHVIDHMGLGGAQTLLRDLIEAQPKNGNIFSLSLRKKNNHYEINHKNNFSSQSANIVSLQPFLLLMKLIRKYNIQVLHCHLFRSFIFGLVVKFIFFQNIKLIYHEHGRIFQSNIVYSNFLRACQKEVDFFIAVSQATKKDLMTKGKIHETKIKVLYNFVNLNLFDKENISWDVDAEKKKLGIPENDFVVGFAGRLIKRKGWFEYLNSAKMLVKDANYSFLLAGDGPDKKKLNTMLIDLGLNNEVKFLGYQSNMVKFYSLLSCLVVPSHWEPMGLTHIEAQAMGIPVVVSDVPALNEIIQDKFNGLIFHVYDSYDLASKIKLLRNNPKLRERIIHNGLINSKKFSLSLYDYKLKLFYSSLSTNHIVEI